MAWKTVFNKGDGTYIPTSTHDAAYQLFQQVYKKVNRKSFFRRIRALFGVSDCPGCSRELVADWRNHEPHCSIREALRAESVMEQRAKINDGNPKLGVCEARDGAHLHIRGAGCINHY